MNIHEPPLIKNRVAQALLEMSGKDSEEVLTFLKERKEVENDEVRLQHFETYYSCSNKRADFFCAITDLANRRLLPMLAGAIFLIYNFIWWPVYYFTK